MATLNNRYVPDVQQAWSPTNLGVHRNSSWLERTPCVVILELKSKAKRKTTISHRSTVPDHLESVAAVQTIKF